MKIFENGYLKSQYLNPNYRGIKGWICEYIINGVCQYHDTVHLLGGTEALLDGMCIDEMCEDGELRGFKIKEFTADDIPEEELVWVLDSVCDVWYLVQNVLTESVFKNCVKVPFLIADDAKKAEELRDWNK